MSTYTQDIDAVAKLKETNGSPWNAINPESVARMRAQNKFKTGLDIAKYTAGIMRRDMAEFDKDKAKYLSIGESNRFTLKFVKPKL